MKTLQIGIIGAGVIAEIAHTPVFNRHSDKFRVVAVCDTEADKARTLAGKLDSTPEAIYTDHRKMLEDPAVDTVLISVPPYLASMIATDALESGKNVLMEKPMGNTGDDAKMVLEVSRKAQGKLIVSEDWFFTPSAMKLREIARKDDWPFGKPHLAALHQFWKMTPRTIPQFYYSSWRHDPRLTYGYLIEGGCHTVNLLRELFGMPEQIRSCMYSVDPKLGVNDTLLANCFLGGETPAQLTMTYGMESPMGRTTLYLHSLEGTIIAHEWDKLTFLSAEGEKTVIPCSSEYEGGHDAFWVHFHDMIVNDAESPFTPEQSYGDIDFMQRLIDAATGED